MNIRMSWFSFLEGINAKWKGEEKWLQLLTCSDSYESFNVPEVDGDFTVGSGKLSSLAGGSSLSDRG